MTVAAVAAVVDPRALRPAALCLVAGGCGRAWVLEGVGLPCPLRTLTGVPCPLCGMTTSVSAVARLDMDAAVAAAPLGLAVMALAVLALSGVWRQPVCLGPWTLRLVVAVAWGWQLARVSLA